MFGDLLEGFVFGFGQIKVQVHEPDESHAAEQHERVVEANKLHEVHVELGHEEAEEEVRRRTNAATQVFTFHREHFAHENPSNWHYAQRRG